MTKFKIGQVVELTEAFIKKLHYNPEYRGLGRIEEIRYGSAFIRFHSGGTGTTDDYNIVLVYDENEPGVFEEEEV